MDDTTKRTLRKRCYEGKNCCPRVRVKIMWYECEKPTEHDRHVDDEEDQIHEIALSLEN
jgi:hypothetical protein